MWRHSHSLSQTDLFTCITVLHCGHTFLSLQPQMSKFDGKTTVLRARTHVIKHSPLGMCYGEVYGNIALGENGWLNRSRYITLPKFELSRFRENGFLFFRAVPADTSHWTSKSARRQNRENWHTHRHTYCNPLAHAHRGLIMPVPSPIYFTLHPHLTHTYLCTSTMSSWRINLWTKCQQ